MTKICLEQNTNAWFEMDGGGQVHLQTLSQDDFKDIKSQTVKKGVEFRRVEGKAERFEYKDTNEDLANELFWDRIIIDWKDLYDSKGNSIECTKSNKMLLMSRSQKFSSFISESLEILKDLDAKRVEEAEKN